MALMSYCVDKLCQHISRVSDYPPLPEKNIQIKSSKNNGGERCVYMLKKVVSFSCGRGYQT